MKAYCCQVDIAWEDKRANFERVRGLLDRAEPDRGSLVVLPEMFATGFSMNVASIAEEPGGETENFLAEAAKRYGIWLAGSHPTIATGGRGRNELVVFDANGELAARYRKMFPFVGGESENFEAGDATTLFEWSGLKVAPFICYDLRFPEIFRSAVHRGAEVIVVVASWPVARIGHWTRLLQARAIENQAFVVGVNRCGRDPSLVYNGQSTIIGPGGDVLVEPWDGEGIRGAELSSDMLRTYRDKLPFLSSIRPEFIADTSGSI